MPLMLSFPLRIAPNGHIAKVERESSRGDAEGLAMHLLTRPRERELFPEFGVDDPVFTFVSHAQLASGASTFGPYVDVDAVEARQLDPTTSEVTVRFT